MNNVVTTRFGVEVFPNPFSNVLNISYYPVYQDRLVQIKVYDVTGRVVKNIAVPKDHIPAPVLVTWHGDDDLDRNVPCGVYFIRIDEKEQSHIKKIIKIH